MALDSIRMRKKVEAFLRGKAPDTRKRLEAFYLNTPSMYGVRANSEFLTVESMVCGVANAADILWCYHFTMKVKYHIIFPMGRTHAVVFLSKDGSQYRAVVPTHNAACKLMDFLKDRMTNTAFGNDQALFDLWNSTDPGKVEKFHTYARAQRQL